MVLVLDQTSSFKIAHSTNLRLDCMLSFMPVLILKCAAAFTYIGMSMACCGVNPCCLFKVTGNEEGDYKNIERQTIHVVWVINMGLYAHHGLPIGLLS